MADANLISIEDMRGFDFSNSRDWSLVIMEDGNDTNQLDPKLKTKFPATTFNISDLNIQIGDVNATFTNLNYVKSFTINTITLGFVDIVGDVIYNWLRDWRINCFDFEEGASGLKDPGVTKLFIFERHNPDKTVSWRRGYLCIPGDDPQFMGTNQSGNNEYSISLTVVGTSSNPDEKIYTKSTVNPMVKSGPGTNRPTSNNSTYRI